MNVISLSPIYIVSRFRQKDSENTKGEEFIGFFHELSTADSAIRENWNNIYDDCYKYVKLQLLNPGFKEEKELVKYYQYNKEKDIYSPVEFFK